MISLTTGCVSYQPKPEIIEKKVYVTTQLELPKKEEVPVITGKDLSCLSERSKLKLLARDAVIKAYIEDLESVILSTREKGD